MFKNNLFLSGCVTFLIGSALSTSVFAGAAGSVVLAFQTIQSQPYAKDARLVEIKGEKGDPFPNEWAMLLADPTARGGVREVGISNGLITAERTPLRGFTDVANSPVIDSSRLLVDAPALFQAVQAESVAARVSFHWLDYTLQVPLNSLSPVWTVKLYDSLGGLVGTMGIFADTGVLAFPMQLPEGIKSESESKKVGGLVGKVSDLATDTAEKTQDTTLRFIGDVQEFLIGERTIGPGADK